jgi:hypothetical protein
MSLGFGLVTGLRDKAAPKAEDEASDRGHLPANPVNEDALFGGFSVL